MARYSEEARTPQTVAGVPDGALRVRLRLLGRAERAFFGDALGAGLLPERERRRLELGLSALLDAGEGYDAARRARWGRVGR